MYIYNLAREQINILIKYRAINTIMVIFKTSRPYIKLKIWGFLKTKLTASTNLSCLSSIKLFYKSLQINNCLSLNIYLITFLLKSFYKYQC